MIRESRNPASLKEYPLLLQEIQPERNLRCEGRHSSKAGMPVIGALNQGESIDLPVVPGSSPCSC
jgi:hypothetical protein